MLLAYPLIAAANNFDMIRVQACVDAYPLRDAAVPPWSNSYLAPIERYRFVDGVDAPCFLTSEALFAFAALPAMIAQSRAREDGSFSIRWVGSIKYLALAALGLFATWRFLRAGQLRLAAAHAIVFLLVINDPGVTIYLSTFYAEFAALFFAYLMVLVVLLELARAAPKSIIWDAVLMLAPMLLALSKVQHIVTPWILTAVVGVVLLTRRDALRRRAIQLFVAGALVGTTLQLGHLKSDRTEVMSRANIVNTVFYGLLENASDPLQTLTHLGLPAECGDSAGKNWFTPGMQEGTLCPTVFSVTRWDVLRAVAADPAMAGRTVIGGIPRMRPWVPSHLGLVGGQELGRLPAHAPSVSSLVGAVPHGAFLPGFLAVALVCAVVGARALQRGRLATGYALLLFGLSPFPLLATVVLGDGYADTAKQAHLAFALLLCGAVSIAVMLVDGIRRAVPDDARVEVTKRGV